MKNHSKADSRHGRVIDFHTHFHLQWHELTGKARHHSNRADPLGAALRWLVWRQFEALRYRYIISRKSLLEAPAERIISRIIRSLAPEAGFNLIARMDKAGVSHAVVLALPPVVSNESVLEECGGSDRLIPFISPRCDLPPEPQIERLLVAGGRGIKLHPVVQNLRVDGDYVTRVAQMAAGRKLPLVIHAGGSGRLFGMAGDHRTEPFEFARLASRVPEASIVVSHAGLWEYPEIIEAICPYRNLFLDISLQSPEAIRFIADRIPLNRILLGSDSPVGNVAIILEHIALAGLSKNESSAICWENAAMLLGLS
ncbi:MAG: amidohydrolase [Candidatus Riflebacteria bacterium]|nr:amidohydrolase [Candidatus Riflebacteria bacterium]